METFDQVLEQYTPMIYSVVKRAKVYKNHDDYRHCATIALWNAWRNYEPSYGPFAPYAYRTMLTTIYREMSKENHYEKHCTSFDKETLTFLAQQMEIKNGEQSSCSDIFLKLETIVSKEEMELLLDLYYYRYKYDELAEKYHVSVSALKKRRNRLIKRLREELG